ncbi:MAG: penicillin-binding protein 2 [Chromatiaceae bacterium]|nr:penicillin-binding protein 2 [Chromatiaceae bacterium]MCF7995096.1 penicillin-binding protein 2 [Chromatiaceae bacterium]MCF8004696.1 penicillin-binding protein 2 [Chromatiaceae bacterium]MCF8016652.1 penicillin-binding protein 2 [Chromatiaceae bacterium]
MLGTMFEDRRGEKRLFRGRAILLAVLVVLSLALIAARLFQLQVVRHEHFTTLSDDNRIKIQPMPPTRGLIYDRNGVLLADNVPSYALTIEPEKVEDIDATIAELSALVPISELDLERFERLLPQRRRFEGVPIRLDLNQAERARFAVQGHRFPGVEIAAELSRYYPEGAYTSHLVGYVGRINEQELEQIDRSDYAGSNHIGKVGVEKYHEQWLHGHVGYQQAVVNARGRVLEQREQKTPVPGRDLHLFLDMDLQRDAAAALGDRRGAVVAIDPETGGVLAMVSSPRYDPNPFVGGIGYKAYAELRDDIDRPLYDRAVRGQYPPGSTVKPFIALAGLATGVTTASQGKYCGGYFQLPGHSHRYRCWRRGGHGSLAMEDAIVQSCDVYFYRLAHDMGIDRLDDLLAEFNFGRPTGVDIAGELGGLLPSPEWKQRVRNRPWFPGETLIVGIGQGAFLATPLQLAAATAAIANGGMFIQPRIVSATRASLGAPLEPTQAQRRPIPDQDPAHWQTILDAMTNVVEGRRGTAGRIRTNAYRIAGKTGTSQVFTVGQNETYNEAEVAERMRDHALFVGFAPIEEPRIAVAVIVENGGHGGATAAPIARAVMDSWLLDQRVQAPSDADDGNSP